MDQSELSSLLLFNRWRFSLFIIFFRPMTLTKQQDRSLQSIFIIFDFQNNKVGNPLVLNRSDENENDVTKSQWVSEWLTDWLSDWRTAGIARVAIRNWKLLSFPSWSVGHSYRRSGQHNSLVSSRGGWTNSLASIYLIWNEINLGQPCKFSGLTSKRRIFT